ncbi:MAG: ABC transporter permease [Gammaproteobacteria bacterium]|nr:ABC transporter permease [Gammaproteobacteria bacterium]
MPHNRRPLLIRAASGWKAGLLEPYRLLLGHRQLLVTLIRRDLVNRTSGTALGAVWVLLQPALQVVAFWFLLDVILQVRFPGIISFKDYFLVGMIPWIMISEVLGQSVNVLPTYRPLYERSRFPVSLIPLVPIVIALLIYGIVFMITAVILNGFGAAIPALITILLIAVWLIPIAYLLSVIGLFIKDINSAMPFILTMSLYLTPILYMPEMIPEALRGLLVLNPFADLLSMVHWAVQGMEITTGNVLRPLLLWMLLLLPGWVLFRRAEPHMREVS